jgi:glycosyltransferase involved in cell wall biosynthesis
MNLKDELISVIVPVFNVEKYLDKCIFSIKSQSYKNLEIILVNDGSPDNCPAICDQHAINDLRIKVIHKINGGLSSARNAGLDIATGKYVTFVDSDDYVTQDYIEVLFNILKKTDSQISVGNISVVKSEEFANKNNLNLSESFKVFSPAEAVMNMYDYEKNLSLQFVTVWGNLYKKYLFESLRFPVGKINEDEYLNYKLFFLANRISYNSKEIYCYLIRDGSIMNSSYSLSMLAKLQALEERIIFFEKSDFTKILNKTRYLYFHNLLFHLYKLKLFFPDDLEIYKLLEFKYYKLCKELVNNSGLNYKEKSIVILYRLFPKLYKYRF